jgi:NitT/TauT family transport system substrate-binding protein
MMRTYFLAATATFLCFVFFLSLSFTTQAQTEPAATAREGDRPLRIAYSDWPGWVAFDIGVKKGWFAEAGVKVELVWMDYLKSMEAYATSKVDAVTMTNGDMLVTGAQGGRSKAILVTDFSNGNDMIVAGPGINSLADLKGKKVGLEVGLVEHLLLLKGLEKYGVDPATVEIVNTPTDQTPEALAAGTVAAIGAWQPHSGRALSLVKGSKPIWTSADSPGLIYDLLCVNPQSLIERREDWKKVVKVWHRISDYIANRKTLPDAIDIMAARTEMGRVDYLPLMAGAFILSPDEAYRRFSGTVGLDSLIGSTRVADDFNVANKIYEKPRPVESYFDISLIQEVLDNSGRGGVTGP